MRMYIRERERGSGGEWSMKMNKNYSAKQVVLRRRQKGKGGRKREGERGGERARVR